MTSPNTSEQLIRTKSGTGDDTIYADGASVPDDADTFAFSPYTPSKSGKGHVSEVELHVIAVDGSGVAQARGTCTYDLRITHVIDRGSSPAVASQITALTGNILQTPIRVPWNGGRMFVGFENIANAPGGATAFEVWAKPVAG